MRDIRDTKNFCPEPGVSGTAHFLNGKLFAPDGQWAITFSDGRKFSVAEAERLFPDIIQDWTTKN
jgi:hypothetical protein